MCDCEKCGSADFMVQMNILRKSNVHLAEAAILAEKRASEAEAVDKAEITRQRDAAQAQVSKYAREANNQRSEIKRLWEKIEVLEKRLEERDVIAQFADDLTEPLRLEILRLRCEAKEMEGDHK